MKRHLPIFGIFGIFALVAACVVAGLATSHADISTGRRYSVQVIDGVTGLTGAPTQATDGVNLSAIRWADRAIILVKSTAGSGTMSVTLRAWCYSSVSGAWHPLGVGDDATKGTLNNGAAIGETGTDLITHVELLQEVSHCDRLDLEVTGISGTATAVSAYLVAMD